MADTDVADRKGTDRQDLPAVEKPMAGSKPDTEDPTAEDQNLAKGGTEEE